MDGNNSTATMQDAQSQPTAQEPAQTPPQAATVDMAQIEQKAQERAEKAAQTTVKEMLKQSGLDDAAIKAMLDDYKAKQTTPEQTIAQLTKERDEGFAERDARIAAYEREKVLRGHGLTDDEDIEVYGIRIDRLVTEGKTFEQAAKEYFAAHPFQTKQPASVVPGVTGATPLTVSELDKFKADYAKAAESHNYAGMSRLIRLANEKGINIT